jgi:hypothetical protein
MKNKALLFTLVFALVAAGIWVVYRMNRTDLTEAIESRFISENENEVLMSKDIRLTHFSEIQEFYENRGFEEVWSTNGKINSQGEDLLDAISEFHLVFRRLGDGLENCQTCFRSRNLTFHNWSFAHSTFAGAFYTSSHRLHPF